LWVSFFIILTASITFQSESARLSFWKPHISEITASIIELIIVTSFFARNAVIQALIYSSNFPVTFIYVNEIVCRNKDEEKHIHDCIVRCWQKK
jgi:hypothetical protein